MSRKLNKTSENIPSVVDIVANPVTPAAAKDAMAAAKPVKPTKCKSTVTKAVTAKSGAATRTAVEHHQPAAADPADVAPIDAVAKSAATIDSVTASGAEINTVAIVAKLAVPPTPPGLAALTDEINSKFCELKRLAKATTCITVELGTHLTELFDHAPDGQWSTLVGTTAVNLRDAAALVAFAEGRHALVEQLSPVRDVPLRDALNHLVNMAHALALTAKQPQQTKPAPGAE